MSTTTTDATTDARLELVREVSKSFVNGPAKEEVARFAKFLNTAIDNPEDTLDAYLEYFLPDPTEGKEFIAKYGVDGTHAQIREFVQSRLATNQ